MNYQKTFEIGKKDNERFNSYSMKRKTLQMSSMVFLVITFMVTLTQLTKGNQLLNATIYGVAYGIAGILFFVITNLLLIKFKLYRIYKKGSIKPFKQQIEMNEKGIHAKTENGSTFIAFNQIGRIHETKHAFYLHINMELVYVFPKKQMSGEEEIKKIRSIFKESISMDRLRLLA